MSAPQASLEAELALIVDMPLEALQQRWQAIGQGEPPRMPQRLLQRLLAQVLQEQHYGAAPGAVAEELEQVATRTGKSRDKGAESIPPSPSRHAKTLSAGTRLVREWNGRTISVEVLDEGYFWNERRYGSLSEIARAVTGTRWSGPRFFGVAGRG